MVFSKIADGNGGKWVLKKKFTFAGVGGIVGSLFAAHGVYLATTTEQIVTLLGAYGTFLGTILALVFAADVTDKKLNNGTYDPK